MQCLAAVTRTRQPLAELAKIVAAHKLRQRKLEMETTAITVLRNVKDCVRRAVINP